MSEKTEAAPYPGHSLFQESFFFCTIQKLGDVPGLGDIHVVTVVDAHCGLAFAKVYSTQTAMNATDILVTRVVPFFKHYGVSIERVFTRKTNEYCGIAPVHPFETFLTTSHIQHLLIDQSGDTPNSPSEQFYHVLLQEFFLPALRNRFQQSLGALQRDLDTFVETYNSERTTFGANGQGRPPLRSFLDAIKA